jgi:hypothetical protein
MKERGEGFWHTYYGSHSELLGWALLGVSILFIAFVISVAAGVVQ